MTLPICFQQKTLYARGQGGQGTMIGGSVHWGKKGPVVTFETCVHSLMCPVKSAFELHRSD